MREKFLLLKHKRTFQVPLFPSSLHFPFTLAIYRTQKAQLEGTNETTPQRNIDAHITATNVLLQDVAEEGIRTQQDQDMSLNNDLGHKVKANKKDIH